MSRERIERFIINKRESNPVKKANRPKTFPETLTLEQMLARQHQAGYLPHRPVFRFTYHPNELN